MVASSASKKSPATPSASLTEGLLFWLLLLLYIWSRLFLLTTNFPLHQYLLNLYPHWPPLGLRRAQNLLLIRWLLLSLTVLVFGRCHLRKLDLDFLYIFVQGGQRLGQRRRQALQAQIFGQTAHHIQAKPSRTASSAASSTATSKRKSPNDHVESDVAPVAKKPKQIAVAPQKLVKSNSTIASQHRGKDSPTADEVELHPSWAAARSRAAILQKPAGRRVVLE